MPQQRDSGNKGKQRQQQQTCVPPYDCSYVGPSRRIQSMAAPSNDPSYMHGNEYTDTTSSMHTFDAATRLSSSSGSSPFQSMRRMKRQQLGRRKSSSKGRSTESSASRFSMISAKLSTVSEPLQRERSRKTRARLSKIFLHKRLTFPFSSPRVLEGEVERFTNPAKSRRSKSLKRHPKRRRHSLAHILTAFKSGTVTTTQQSHEPTSAPTYSFVRSSMLVHISDKDIRSTQVPEVLYNDSVSSSNCSTSSNIMYAGYPTCHSCNDNQVCTLHGRQQQQQQNRHSDPGFKVCKQRSRPNTEGSWFYSWIQHHSRQKTKQCPHITYNSSSLTGTDSDKEQKSSQFYFHPPTISDLSSFSTPFSRFASSTHLKSIQFSAFWFDSYGQSGKQTVRVDGNGAVAMIRKKRARLCEHCSRFYPSPDSFTAPPLLFLCGFVCFPLWWIGAWIHWRQLSSSSSSSSSTKHLSRDPESQFVSTTSPRIFGWLNCCMTGLSLALTPIIIGLAVWYSLST